MRAKCQHLCKMPHIPHCSRCPSSPPPPAPPRCSYLLVACACLLVPRPVPSVRPACLPVPRLSTVGNVLFTTSATSSSSSSLPVAAAQLAAQAATCNGYGYGGVVVVVGNWRPPSALTSPETSFRSRIDLERVSAL